MELSLFLKFSDCCHEFRLPRKYPIEREIYQHCQLLFLDTFFVEKQLKTFDRGGTPSVYESFVIKGEKLPRALCPRNYKKNAVPTAEVGKIIGRSMIKM